MLISLHWKTRWKSWYAFLVFIRNTQEKKFYLIEINYWILVLIFTGKFNCTFEMEYEARAIFFGFLVTALFFIPLSLMILLYSLVITTLWKGMQLETQSAGRELVVVNSGNNNLPFFWTMKQYSSYDISIAQEIFVLHTSCTIAKNAKNVKMHKCKNLAKIIFQI